VQASAAHDSSAAILCGCFDLYSPLHQLIQRLGIAAKLPFAIHPHMLCHACGFKLGE
jgi:hypothetical protein